MMRLANEDYKAVTVGHICLTHATPAHAQVMLNAMEPDKTRNFSFFLKPVSLTRQRNYLRAMEKSETDLLFLVSLADGMVPVGTAGLHEIDLGNKNARIGLLIFREQDRSKGYGGEATEAIHQIAFNAMHLHKLYARLLATNDAARKKYAERGYREEGLLRQEYLLGDTFHDMVVMGLLGSEWRAHAAS